MLTAGQGAGRVWVKVAATGVDSFSIAVRDEGDGVPEDLEFGKGKGLGARMVRALAQQLGGEFEIVARHPGVEFILTAPLAHLARRDRHFSSSRPRRLSSWRSRSGIGSAATVSYIAFS